MDNNRLNRLIDLIIFALHLLDDYLLDGAAAAVGGLALPVPRRDAVLAHVRGPRDVVQLLVETAAVAEIIIII